MDLKLNEIEKERERVRQRVREREKKRNNLDMTDLQNLQIKCSSDLI